MLNDYKKNEKRIRKMQDSKWIEAMEIVKNHDSLEKFKHNEYVYLVHYIPEGKRNPRKLMFHEIESRGEDTLYFIQYSKDMNSYMNSLAQLNVDINSKNKISDYKSDFSREYETDKPNSNSELINKFEIEFIEICKKSM